MARPVKFLFDTEFAAEAKQEATRDRRIEKIVASLRA